MERAKGIEPSFPFRKAKVIKPAYIQHNGTLLTPVNVSIIVSSHMASVHRRPNSKYFHAAFRTSDGALVLRSTKCTERAKALAAAFEFERAAKLAGAGNLVEAQARKIVADIMERAGTEETLRAPTIKAYFDQWITAKKAVKE